MAVNVVTLSLAEAAMAARANMATPDSEAPRPPSRGPPVMLPYSGAKTNQAVRLEATRLGDRDLYGSPAPAWVDVGMGSHMRGLVPSPEPSWPSGQHHTEPEVLRPRLQYHRFAFRSIMVLSSASENIACHFAFWNVWRSDNRLYNKFEAHAYAVPDLDMLLLLLTAMNTLYLFIFFVLTALFKLSLHRTMATARLPLSLGCGFICAWFTLMAEDVFLLPFLGALFALLHLGSVCFAWAQTRKDLPGSRCRRLLCYLCVLLVVAAAAAWCHAWSAQRMGYWRNEGCRASENTAMPVRVPGVEGWRCVRWGQSLHLLREANASEPVHEAKCLTSFRQLFPGGSSRAHLVRCPPQWPCQDLRLGTSVLGCGVYDDRSPVCAAAMQMGIIDLHGGVVKAVGRPPPARFERCARSGVTSAHSAAELLARSSSSEIDDASAPWAFYFQEAPGMEAHDMVTLHGFRRVATPSWERPWKAYVANVTWAAGGSEPVNQEVVLGPAEGPSPGGEAVELNFCHGPGPAENACP